MEPAIRGLQFPATSILDRLQEGSGGIAYVILKIRVAVEIVVARCIWREVTDVTIDKGQMA